MKKTKIIVTRVYEGKRTPQEAFAKAIIHSGTGSAVCFQGAENKLNCEITDSIIKRIEPPCGLPVSPVKGEANEQPII